jgi:integrase
LTVGAWLDIWLAEYNKAVKERTLLVYKGHADYRIKPAIGAKKLSALRPHDIQTFLNQQGEETGGKKALSPKSVKDVHGVLHKALAQAVLNGYITSNPADFCELPRIQKKEMKPLDSAQITGFLDAIKGHQFETLYTVALFTGLRQGEILGLTWDCLNGEALFVYRQLQLIKGAYKLVPLKNDKMRSITLPPAVIKAFKEQKREQAKKRLKAGEAWSNAENYIFTNELGEHLARQTVYKSFKRIVGDLGIPAARFHDLRHSYAVAAIQSGDDIKTVQENLGHATASFTLDVYGHVTNQMKRESAARMEKFINRVRGRKML